MTGGRRSHGRWRTWVATCATATTAAALLVVCVAASPAAAHNFTGAQACGSCHAFEYEVWAKSAHARAHLSLTAEQLGDGRCASCHSNVMAALDQQAGEGSGAVGDVAVGERDGPRSALTQALHDKALLGVQCEHCHGPGKLYSPTYVMRDKMLARALGLVDSTPAGCRGCHTDGAPSLEPFDYATLWARIDHSRQARERWAEEKQGSGQTPGPRSDPAQTAGATQAPTPTPTLAPSTPAAPAKRPAASTGRSRRHRGRGH